MEAQSYPHQGKQQQEKGQHEGSGPGRQEQIPAPFCSNPGDSQQQAAGPSPTARSLPLGSSEDKPAQLISLSTS
jgi:hypothetical protein